MGVEAELSLPAGVGRHSCGADQLAAFIIASNRVCALLLKISAFREGGLTAQDWVVLRRVAEIAEPLAKTAKKTGLGRKATLSRASDLQKIGLLNIADEESGLSLSLTAAGRVLLECLNAAAHEFSCGTPSSGTRIRNAWRSSARLAKDLSRKNSSDALAA